MVAVHAVVSGQVQGVGFRWRCLQQAQAIGVCGWVRNMPDGKVELWAEGEDGPVQQLLDWCRQGPRWARVDRVEERRVTPRGLGSFEVR
ncbi:acylphosphatase [Luteococcus japonicus]|uniref:Acylphosphatase n=1 Tax=Luteococcus japonicus TaxID=33984 RepID=A0A3N1ZVA9_9ACTN|nr:acylphosphatase [Luteococcus japonicus]ROR54779.1 acylphosphatase [Luteococcus japonicus]